MKWYEKDWVVRAAWGAVAILLVSGMVGGIYRGVHHQPNWGSLQGESAYVWMHRAFSPGTAMFGYLPTTVFLLWPFMVWPPEIVGIVLYNLANLAAAVGSAWIVYRWWLNAEERKVFVWALLLVAANFQQVMQANQLTLWTLVFCLAGLTLVGYRREWLGGMAIGLAGLIKVMPFFLVGYLLIRKQWRALAGVGLAIVVFDLAPSVVFFGARGTVDVHREWVARAGCHSNGRQIADPLLIGVYKHTSNFSYSSVLRRWLSPMPAAREQVVLTGRPPKDAVEQCRSTLRPDQWLTLDPMPERDKEWAVKTVNLARLRRFHAASLSLETVWWVWAATLGLGLAALVGYTWKNRACGVKDWRWAGAMWILAMFFVVPMMRHYYLAMAFPAVLAAVLGLREGQRLSLLAVLAWVIGILCLGWDTGRWYGLHLGVVLILLAALAHRWVRPRPCSA